VGEFDLVALEYSLVLDADFEASTGFHSIDQGMQDGHDPVKFEGQDYLEIWMLKRFHNMMSVGVEPERTIFIVIYDMGIPTELMNKASFNVTTRLLTKATVKTVRPVM
jgi:hypothetical protein